MRKILFVLLTLLLGGCQTWGPTWSEVTGYRYPNAAAYQFRRPAIVEHVDNQGSFATDPIKVDPGTHRIRTEPGMRQIILGAPVPRWPGGSDLKVMMLDVEPCKRYYINAQFENNVTIEWKPVIDYVDTIAGCTIVAAK